MTYRTRIYYSDAQKAQMWDRWKRGESLKSIGRQFDRGSNSIYGVLSVTGGIRPSPRKRSALALTLSEREEISRGVALGQSVRLLATHIGRSPSTISREINRNGGYDGYRATKADQAVLISRANRRLAKNPIPWRGAQSRVPRDNLPKPVHPGARSAQKGATPAPQNQTHDTPIQTCESQG